MRVLITGVAGYLGSNMANFLTSLGHYVVGVDNFSTGSRRYIDILTTSSPNMFSWYELDLCEMQSVKKIFSENAIDAVIHFAGYRSVIESSIQPVKYYFNNVTATLNLIKACNDYDCKKFIFSSSCTVYGNSDILPVTESTQLNPISPYGQSKKISEDLLYLNASDERFRVISLRYFNPLGAGSDFNFGDNPSSNFRSILPALFDIVSGKTAKFKIFGDRFDTSDGTAERDYIHVDDLIESHCKALAHLEGMSDPFMALNIGLGKPVSVLKLIKTFSEVTGKHIDFDVLPARRGEAARAFSCNKKAKDILKWNPNKSLEEMILSHWKWFEGYSS